MNFEIKTNPATSSDIDQIGFPATLIIVDDNFNIIDAKIVGGQESIAQLLSTLPDVKEDLSNVFISDEMVDPDEPDEFWHIKYQVDGQNSKYFIFDKTERIVVEAQGSIEYITSIYNNMIQKSEMLAIYSQNVLNTTPDDALANAVLALVDDIDKVNEWVSQGLPLHTQVQEEPGAWKNMVSAMRRLSFVIDSL